MLHRLIFKSEVLKCSFFKLSLQFIKSMFHNLLTTSALNEISPQLYINWLLGFS